MEAINAQNYTLEEYFALCETNEGRLEFVNGKIIELHSETVTASQITGNIHFHLRGLLKNLFINRGDGCPSVVPDFSI